MGCGADTTDARNDDRDLFGGDAFHVIAEAAHFHCLEISPKNFVIVNINHNSRVTFNAAEGVRNGGH